MSCRVLGVRREGYYAWKHRPVRTDCDAQLVSALKEAREQHPCYGVRGLREAIDPALRPSYGKCYRLCKENGLLQRKKRPHGLAKCNHRDPQSDDLVQRDFTARKPGVKYLSDITADGRLYLAAVMDCYRLLHEASYACRPVLRCPARCGFTLWLPEGSDTALRPRHPVHQSGIPGGDCGVRLHPAEYGAHPLLL